jgi:hypothetical protein
MITDRDNKFISNFFEKQIPKNKNWLRHYFKTPIKKAFLIYFLEFNSTMRFREHTGFLCSERYIKKLKNILLKLEKEIEFAKRQFDIEKIAKIEMGKYKLF